MPLVYYHIANIHNIYHRFDTHNLKTTILVEKTTREVLKQLGSKGQSYDNLINWLISNKTRQIEDRDTSFKTEIEVKNALKKKNSLDDRSASRESSESL